MRLLTPEAILSRLEHRLPLLTGGARDLPARQQTLRSTIAWSHDLLSGEEQRIYRRLTVFVRGCTLEAAESVCRPESGPAGDVLEGIAALVDKSLLRQVEDAGGYNHGDIAIPVLEESLTLARELGDQSGIAWATYTMGRAAAARGDYERTGALVDDSLTRFRALDDVVGCSYACWYLGNVATRRGEYTQAAGFFEESLAWARQAGDTWAIASALMNAADLTLELREFERTTVLLRESLRHYLTLRAAWAICIVLDMMAVVAVDLGRFQRAARLFGAEEALRDAVGSAINARWRAVHDGRLGSARDALGDETFAVLWAEGRAMTREQVIAYALEDAVPT